MYFQDSIKMKQNWVLAGALIVLFPILSLAQVKEKIDRGPVALTVKEKVVYVGWRLLKDDPDDVAFNVYRRDMGLGDFVEVDLTIYDVRGKKLRGLMNGPARPGRNEVAWNGRNDRGMLLGSGLYLYRLAVGNKVETRRMVLLK